MNGSAPEEAKNVAASDEVAGYEPPRIEIAMNEKDLEREVLYAGNAFTF
jgi:hypothetical protein